MNIGQTTKILQVCTIPLNENGISRFLARALSAMDMRGLQVDVACFTAPSPAIKQQLEGCTGQFHLLPPRNSSPAAYYKALRQLVEKQQYRVVHAHGNSATLALEMCAAKAGGAAMRIAHSHNTACVHTAFNKLLAPVFHRSYTHAMACSAPAAGWLFDNRPCTVVQNGVDTALFQFSAEQRASARQELGLEDQEFAVCAVAGFTEAKNHGFMLNMFARLLALRPESRLVLIGEGPLLPQIRMQANSMGIAHRVIFTAARNDVPRLLCGMDAAVLPSLFEGLPAAALEYQCSGLPTLLSDNITSEAAPTALASLLPLEQQAWANALARICPEKRAETSADAVLTLHSKGLTQEAMAASMRAVYLQ